MFVLQAHIFLHFFYYLAPSSMSTAVLPAEVLFFTYSILMGKGYIHIELGKMCLFCWRIAKQILSSYHNYDH